LDELSGNLMTQPCGGTNEQGCDDESMISHDALSFSEIVFLLFFQS